MSLCSCLQFFLIWKKKCFATLPNSFIIQHCLSKSLKTVLMKHKFLFKNHPCCKTYVVLLFLKILKNCQNGTFLPMHEIWIFFGPNDFIWSSMKVPFCDFIQNVPQAPSMCISMWIKVNTWNHLKNPSQEVKNSFCFRFLWNW